MNRKVVYWGVGIVTAIIIGMGALGYFFLWVPFSEIKADVEQMAEMSAMNDELRNQSEFVPPPDGELTLAQVNRYTRVMDGVHRVMREDPFFQERAEILSGLRQEEEGVISAEDVGIREFLRSLKGVGPYAVRAKRVQIEAMDREGFSLDEYRWVRERVYQSLGISNFDVYIEDDLAAFKTGKRVKRERAAPPPVTENNRTLAASLSTRVKAWHPYYLLGM